MSGYRDMIIEDTGCNPDDAVIVEHIMRVDIFHSTLDWQTRAQLRGAARKAFKLLKQNRDLYELERAESRIIFEEMRRTALSKDMEDKIDAVRGSQTEKPFPYTIPKRKGLKFVWRANKEGGQNIGNREVVVPVTKEIFKKDVLPRSRKGYYRGATMNEKYKDFLRKEPDAYASYVDNGKGWKLIKIDRFDKISLKLAEEEKGWLKLVDSFESPEAVEFRKEGDSETPNPDDPG